MPGQKSDVVPIQLQVEEICLNYGEEREKDTKKRAQSQGNRGWIAIPEGIAYTLRHAEDRTLAHFNRAHRAGARSGLVFKPRSEAAGNSGGKVRRLLCSPPRGARRRSDYGRRLPQNEGAIRQSLRVVWTDAVA